MRTFLGPGIEDDAAQNGLPGNGRYLDNSSVGKELREIAFDRPRLCRIRRTQIDEKNADLTGGWSAGSC